MYNLQQNAMQTHPIISLYQSWLCKSSSLTSIHRGVHMQGKRKTLLFSGVEIFSKRVLVFCHIISLNLRSCLNLNLLGI